MPLRKGFKRYAKKALFKKTLVGFGFKGRGRGIKAYGKYSSPASTLIAAIKRLSARRAYGDRKSLYRHYKRMTGRK